MVYDVRTTMIQCGMMGREVSLPLLSKTTTALPIAVRPPLTLTLQETLLF